VTESIEKASSGTACRRFALQRPGRRAIFTLLLLIALLALHPLGLRFLVWPLESAGPSVPAGYYCLHGDELGIDGFDALDRAAEWQGRAGGTVLLMLPRTSRIVEIGATPSFERFCRRELTNRGVPASKIESIPAGARNTWDEARALSLWLDQHLQATVSLACSPYGGGKLRYVLDAVLGPGNARRVCLVSLANPGCPVDSWWRTRAGVKEFMFAWLDLLYTWGRGDDAAEPQISATAFQKDVRKAIGEAPR
jgi:hypothetical protein